MKAAIVNQQSHAFPITTMCRAKGRTGKKNTNKMIITLDYYRGEIREPIHRKHEHLR